MRHGRVMAHGSWLMAKWHFRRTNFCASDIRPTDFLFSGGHIFRRFKSILLLKWSYFSAAQVVIFFGVNFLGE
jgi:hypothetical protein